MTQFKANAARIDPYKNFKFRVKWDGRYVAGASKVSLVKQTSLAKPGSRKFEPITIERGVTHDSEFEQWANGVFEATDYRSRVRKRDLAIELFDEAGRLALAYEVRGAWVSEYLALPDLDANANAVAIAKIKIDHEGWNRTAIKSG